MTTETHAIKTFPAQPAWNSGAAVGAIAGLLASAFVPSDLFWFPQLTAYPHAWAANVLACGIAGSLLGCAVGAIKDRFTGTNVADPAFVR